jgi:hypothetical protein
MGRRGQERIRNPIGASTDLVERGRFSPAKSPCLLTVPGRRQFAVAGPTRRSIGVLTARAQQQQQQQQEHQQERQARWPWVVGQQAARVDVCEIYKSWRWTHLR